jgi:hypothetical protein
MLELPVSDGALVVRVNSTHQQVWDDLCGLIRAHVSEGFFSGVLFVDDPRFHGMTPRQLLAHVPADGDCPYLVVDALTTTSSERPQDRSLLLVDLEERPGSACRAIASELATIDSHLAIGHTDFSTFAEGVDEDGVYRGE